MNKYQPPTAELQSETTAEAAPETSTIQERHPDWPKLNVSFYFSPHANAENFKDVPERIAKSDIYLFEHPGASEAKNEFIQALADGSTITLEDAINSNKGQAWEQIVRGIHDTQKAVDSIDLTDDIEYASIREDIGGVSVHIADTFKESVDILGEDTAISAEAQREREQIMAGRFEEVLDKILDKRPDLKEKNELNILLTMGAYHTNLRHLLAEEGILSSREFSTPSTYVYSHYSELKRTYAYHREPSQDLLEQAWVEQIVDAVIADKIGPEAHKTFQDSIAIYLRDIVAKLTHDQREQLYELVYDSPNASMAKLYDAANRLLEDSDIDPMPETSQQLIEQLQATERLSLKGLAGHARRFRSTSP